MGRWHCIALGVALVFLAGCGETTPSAVDSTADPTTTVSLPGAPTAPLPTPTLAAGASTPAPAPVKTDSNEADTADGSVRLEPLSLPDVAVSTPAEHLAAGELALHNGDYARAESHFQAALDADLDTAEQSAALYGLGTAYFRDGRTSDAATIFNQIVQVDGDSAPSAVHYYLAQTAIARGDAVQAQAAYEAYLAANPDMAGYVLADIGSLAADNGNIPAAIDAYTRAVDADANRLHNIETRQKLADLHRQNGDIAAAVAQYDAIRDLAVTETTKGAMTYLAGATLIAAGDTQAGYERYQFGIANYPRAYDSYNGLIELVNAGVPVDEFQRGLVDLYAEAYQPAVEAFERYLAANPESYDPAALLYLAQSYRALGNTDAALAALDRYAQTNPEEAQIERARTLAFGGQGAAAIAAYDNYLAQYPGGEQAPFATWWAAVLTEQAGDIPGAVARYTAVADAFPDHKDAPEALYHAGWLAYNSDDTPTAVTLWQRAASSYPTADFGAAAMVWLLRTVPSDDPAVVDIAELARTSDATHYFALRAQDIVNGREPFTAGASFALPADEAAELATAEAWLRSWLELDPATAVADLSPAIAADPRYVRGTKLWELGLYQPALREIESVRAAYAEDALASFQLALALRDLGLYRSSIGAAGTVLSLSGQNVFQAPPLIGHLLYPAYYADLIVPLAQQYGYDPRLQLALVRQESLFESFATSSAVAQGLSQVIPDTGAFIAQQLAWPDYENADLYLPYVGLTFGAHYLGTQLDAFDGTVHAALSAYNAGPGNAARWYDIAGSDLDTYIETVDFAETRLYIERIYTGFNIYRHLYR